MTHGLIFNIQEYSIQDGKGIRTTVFLKGCPLSCRWCSNPEGQMPYTELMHSSVLCKQCQRCVEACPQGAISIYTLRKRGESKPQQSYFSKEENTNDKQIKINRDSCLTCEEKICETVCPQKAIKIMGQYWSPEALYEKVKACSLFYRNSDGGITLSGGEPLSQALFVKDFLALCELSGLSVGVETSGLFHWNEVEEYIDSFDFYYFDIKCPDSQLHQYFTGCNNKLILNNLKQLSNLDSSKITVTIPVIPGFNSFAETIEQISQLCSDLNISKTRLLTYHTLGENKYNELGKTYTMESNLTLNHSDMENFRTIIINKGIDCSIEY